jgi:4-aminobutyrate aminotransferase-like enzyme
MCGDLPCHSTQDHRRFQRLKIKPPLCSTEANADHVADVLERILTEGW